MKIRTFGSWIGLVLVLPPFLSSCGSPYLFGPAKVGSSYHLEFEDDTRGGLQGDGAAALYERGTESVVVGWEHFDDGDRVHNHVYRGGVKFNVGLLSESPPKTVTKATPTYTVQTGANSSSKPFVDSCATQLYLGNDDWHGIPEIDIAKAPSCVHSSRSGVLATVLSYQMVRRWHFAGDVVHNAHLLICIIL